MNKKSPSTTVPNPESQIKKMNGLIVKGTSKFDSEIAYSYRIPEDQRYLIKFVEPHQNEIVNQSSSPMQVSIDTPNDEEVIESHFDSRILY